MNLILTPPADEDFKLICKYIHEFELDDRELKREEFCAAFRDRQLLGFGRMRKHADCTELCSLGVLLSHRNKGIGSAITAELLRKDLNTIYVVCIIPDFFKVFGFRQVDAYPASIYEKLAYCTQSLPVAETYVVMRLERSH